MHKCQLQNVTYAHFCCFSIICSRHFVKINPYFCTFFTFYFTFDTFAILNYNVIVQMHHYIFTIYQITTKEISLWQNA